MSADFEYCAHCGAKLPKNEWCPTVAGRNCVGTLRVHAFCDEDCKAAWVEDAEDTSEDTDGDETP